jgi:hypothetical protein
LWGKVYVPYYRNTRFNDLLDVRGKIVPALHFHEVGPALLNNAASAIQGLKWIDLVAHEGHVANYQGIWCPSAHGLAVIDDFLDLDWVCVFRTPDDHAQRIAD